MLAEARLTHQQILNSNLERGHLLAGHPENHLNAAEKAA